MPIPDEPSRNEVEYQFETDKVFFKDERPEMTLARVDWLKLRQKAELIIFMSHQSVATEAIQQALTYLDEAHSDFTELITTGFGVRADIPLTETHPNTQKLQVRVTRFQNGEDFTLQDFLTLNDNSPDAAKDLPKETVDTLTGMVNELLDPSHQWKGAIEEVVALTDTELIAELDEVSTDDNR
jgi:hypothetical protein